MNTNLVRIINYRFPTISNVYGYGSGFVKQTNNKATQLDLIFVVENTNQFHSLNIKINPLDYSLFSRLFGLSLLHSIGSKMVYFPLVKTEDVVLKYGVISARNAEMQLSSWSSLFLAGRLHKPIVELKTEKNLDLYRNRKNAVFR